MRIVNPSALASVSAGGGRGSRRQRGARPGAPGGLLRRVNAYTLWAFNPQRELSSRYDRAA